MKKNFFYVALQNFSLSVPFLLVLPMGINPFGAEFIGSIVLAQTIGGFFSNFLQYAFAWTAIPKILREGRESPVLTTIMSAKAILLLIAFIAAVFLYLATRKITEVQLIIILCQCLIGALNFSWYLQYKGKFKNMAYLAMLASIITVLFAYYGAAVLKNKYIYALSPAIGLLLYYFYGFAVSFTNGCASDISFKRGSVVLRQDLPIFLSQIISVSYASGGVLITSHCFGLEVAAIYGLAERIYLITAMVTPLLLQATFPTIAEYAKSSSHLLKDLIKKLIFSHLLFSAVICTILIFLRGELDVYYFKLETAEFGGLFLSMMLMQVVSFSGPLASAVLAAKSRNGSLFFLTVGMFVLTLLLFVLFFEHFGVATWPLALALSSFVVGGCVLVRNL